MYDKELALDILTQILEATKKINQRFQPIKNVDDFTNTPAGMEKLDSLHVVNRNRREFKKY